MGGPNASFESYGVSFSCGNSQALLKRSRSLSLKGLSMSHFNVRPNPECSSPASNAKSVANPHHTTVYVSAKNTPPTLRKRMSRRLSLDVIYIVEQTRSEGVVIRERSRGRPLEELCVSVPTSSLKTIFVRYNYRLYCPGRENQISSCKIATILWRSSRHKYSN